MWFQRTAQDEILQESGNAIWQRTCTAQIINLRNPVSYPNVILLSKPFLHDPPEHCLESTVYCIPAYEPGGLMSLPLSPLIYPLAAILGFHAMWSYSRIKNDVSL